MIGSGVSIVQAIEVTADVVDNAVYKEILEKKPNDTIATLFITRCKQLQKDPPSDDWDGVWRFTEK